MGEITALHIVVTGAGGYLGRAIVNAAKTRGHRVTEIYRSGQNGLVQDLAETDASDVLAAQIETADAVIHAASEMSTDWDLHLRSTLPATYCVCELAQKLQAHLVQISSISVYDFAAVAEGETVSEQSPIEPNPELRDGYMRAKLAQENIIAELIPGASVLRVGAVFGPGRIMNAHLGVGIGPLLLRLASRGQIPLAHIDMVADIALRAAEQRATGAVNVLETDLPDRIRFIETLSRSGWPKLVLPLPWKALSILGAMLVAWTSRPGLLRNKVLHARMKPLAYANTLMRSNLGEASKDSFETLMTRAMHNV